MNFDDLNYITTIIHMDKKILQRQREWNINPKTKSNDELKVRTSGHDFTRGNKKCRILHDLRRTNLLKWILGEMVRARYYRILG